MVMSFQMKMTAVLSGLLFTVTPIAVDANEDKLTKGYYTFDSMGCMLLRECTEGVKEVHSLLDISSQYEEPEKFTHVSREFNNMLTSLHTVGVKVFLADEKYFPVGHRGVYHTVSNNFYLNRRFMHRPHVLMSVMRLSLIHI